MGASTVDWGRVPRLHVVTDDDVMAAPDFPAVSRALVAAGGGGVALHVRGPRTSGRRLHIIASDLLAAAAQTGAWVVVNDRVDVALATGARVVHLAGRSLPAVEARRILGEDARIGVSCHTPDEAADASREGADWIFAGTTYPTPSHRGREGCGPEGVHRASVAAGGVPVLAIGGVTAERVSEVVAAGAHGVAVVRAVWSAPDPVVALKEFLHELARDAGGTGSP